MVLSRPRSACGPLEKTQAVVADADATSVLVPIETGRALPLEGEFPRVIR